MTANVSLQVADTILDTIGNTPLVRLHKMEAGLNVTLYAKVELFNPGGSIKDRIALNMIEAAEAAGHLKPGGTIIEATAGNTGAGLALVAAQKGYRCIFVLPDKMSSEKVNLLKAYGAEVVITPTSVPPDSPESYNGVADRLARDIPNAFRPGQFDNPNNPAMHEKTTGPEIWNALDGQLDVLVAGMGTGGSISGLGRYFKSKNASIQIIGADPEGSILSGDSPKSFKVEGIGEDFIPATFDRQVVDDMVRVSDAESFHAARRLAREEGILVGGSSGTAMAAALKYAQRLEAGKTMVVVFPDTGRNYLSKQFSDDWMREHGFLEEPGPELQVKDLLSQFPCHPVATVEADQPIRSVLSAFEKTPHTTYVVTRGGQPIGRLGELTLLSYMRQKHFDMSEPVEHLMGKPLPTVELSTHLSEVARRFLSGYDAIVVMDGGPKHLITKHQLLQYYAQQSQATAS